MAVVIRFARHGAKKAPFYRVVAADKSASRDGRFLELLGWYNPKHKEASLKAERIDYWIKQGAQPSDTVKSLFKKNGVAVK